MQNRRGEEASEGGTALIEFVLIFPLLLLLFFGVIDFGRAYNAYICLNNAALTGAEYGTFSGQSTNFTGMVSAATNDSAGLSGFSATASKYCACSPGGVAVSCSTTCSTYGVPIAYVVVQTSATVPILFRYMTLTGSYSLQSAATLRVQ